MSLPFPHGTIWRRNLFSQTTAVSSGRWMDGCVGQRAVMTIHRPPRMRVSDGFGDDSACGRCEASSLAAPMTSTREKRVADGRRRLGHRPSSYQLTVNL